MKNKFNLPIEQNRQLVRDNMAKLCFVASRFEDVTTTLTQTRQIISGLHVNNVPIDAINVIVQLKHGWEIVITPGPLTFSLLKSLNRTVALHDSLDPGNLRTGSGIVNTKRGEFIPVTVNPSEEQQFIHELLNDEHHSTTDKALTLMYHLMRQQMFWDGNKRTALLAANKLMIDGCASLISIPLAKWRRWNELIADYYFTGEMTKLKQWTYQNGIQGTSPLQI